MCNFPVNFKKDIQFKEKEIMYSNQMTQISCEIFTAVVPTLVVKGSSACFSHVVPQFQLFNHSPAVSLLALSLELLMAFEWYMDIEFCLSIIFLFPLFLMRGKASIARHDERSPDQNPRQTADTEVPHV